MITATKPADTNRMQELVLHAKDGSPIALEAVRASLRRHLLDAPPSLVLEMAERLLLARRDGLAL